MVLLMLVIQNDVIYIYKFKKVTRWYGVRSCSGVCYPRFIQFDLGIVNIMKVYIERNNIQVELIRFRQKCRLYSRLRLRGERVPERASRTTLCLQPIR